MTKDDPAAGGWPSEEMVARAVYEAECEHYGQRYHTDAFDLLNLPRLKLIARAVLQLFPAQEGWRDIATAPANAEPCWIGHSLTGTRVVAYKDPVGGWRIMWCDNFVPWTPDCWHPLPSRAALAKVEPPRSSIMAAADRAAERVKTWSPAKQDHARRISEPQQLKAGEEIRDGKLYGWTGYKCKLCDGTGEAGDYRPCCLCGGTGDEWGLMPDPQQRAYEELKRTTAAKLKAQEAIEPMNPAEED